MTPDHKWLISGSKDQSVHFWDELNDNETQVMIRGHKQTGEFCDSLIGT